MRYILIIFTIFYVAFFPDVTSAKDTEEMMRVRLVNHVGETKKMDVTLKGDYFTLDPTLGLEEGVEYTLSVEKGSLILKGNNKSYKIQDTLLLIPRDYNHDHVIHIDDRLYLGAMEFRVEDNEYVRPVNQLPLEDYLKGVVPFEVFPEWGLETLKAQALAARTYAASHVNEEIDDTISYQVYGGYEWSKKPTKAVEETIGEVITYKNELINAYYSASNGGITENNSHVWGGEALPFFPIKEDPYDPKSSWEFTVNETQMDVEEVDWNQPNWWNDFQEKDQEIMDSMKNWLNRNGYPGEIKILSIPNFELADQQLSSDRSVKGSITIEFLWRWVEGTVLYQQLDLDHVDLNRIRPLIGGEKFKSYLIDSLEKEDDVYTMKGKGYGHGVGMSQWGAHKMGEEGKTYKEIIQFYFPKTKIKQLDDGIANDI